MRSKTLYLVCTSFDILGHKPGKRLYIKQDESDILVCSYTKLTKTDILRNILKSVR